MIVLVAAEPELSRHSVEEALGLRVDRVLAPWKLPAATPAVGPLARFVRLRRGEPAARGLPGYPLVELCARGWARGQTPRILSSRLALRRALSLWAARALGSLGSRDTVIAPTLVARRVFAAAPSARKVLWQDLPCMRRLHRDLDAQAERYPESRYLRRYRAPEWAVVDQEVEWELADRIAVRGRYARDVLLEAGLPAHRLARIGSAATIPTLPRRAGAPGEVHLIVAGIAGARHCTNELLAALDERPWLHLHLRGGEGAEPAELLSHPRAVALTEKSWERASALAALSCCEAYFPEVRRAAACGLAIIATEPACAWLEKSELAAVVNAGSIASLGSALDHCAPRPFRGEIDRRAP
jgi:hypothetical protein